jgi:hypothetical protein
MHWKSEKPLQVKMFAHVKKMLDELVDSTNRRRDWHGSKFTIQALVNSLVVGLYEAEAEGVVDWSEMKRIGVLASLVDSGARRLNRDIAREDVKPARPVKALTLAGKAEAAEDPKRALPPPKKEKKLRTLKLPYDMSSSVSFKDWVNGVDHS